MREMVYVALASGELERLMSHDPAAARLNVDPQFAISDPQVVSIVLNMRKRDTGGLSGRTNLRRSPLIGAGRVLARAVFPSGSADGAARSCALGAADPPRA